MTFEVYQDGRCKMATESPRCIYPERILRSMQSAGCTFRLDGKRISLKSLLEEIKNMGRKS